MTVVEAEADENFELVVVPPMEEEEVKVGPTSEVPLVKYELEVAPPLSDPVSTELVPVTVGRAEEVVLEGT